MALFLKLLGKAKKVPIGTTTQRKDGAYKKVGPSQWVPVKRETSAVDYQVKQAKSLFTQALHGGEGGHYLRFVLEEDFGVKNYEDLRNKIESGPRNTAHKIFKGTKDYIDTTDLPSGEKQRMLDSLGRSLIKLRDLYAGPKRKLTMKVRGKKGQEYYVRPKAAYYEPPLRATALKSAKQKIGGWSDMSKTPTTSQVRKMMDKGTATLTFGKINSKKKWHLKQDKGINDVVVPFREDEDGIKVRLRQVKKTAKRTRRTAEVELEIPYAVAKEFLKHQVDATRTKNELIRQLNNSKGYQRFIQEKAA